MRDIETVYKVGDKVFNNKKEAEHFVSQKDTRSPTYKKINKVIEKISVMENVEVFTYLPIDGMKIEISYFLTMEDREIEITYNGSSLLNTKNKSQVIVSLIENGLNSGNCDGWSDDLEADEDMINKVKQTKEYKKFNVLVNKVCDLYGQLSSYEKELVKDENEWDLD